MKFYIEWHEHCLKNNKAYHQKLVAELNSLKSKVFESMVGIVDYEHQIAVARNRGIKSFDSERFLKKRAKK